MNPEQRLAVTAPIDVPLVVSAGPGSGKTFVLIERIIHILELSQHDCNVLVLAFSRSAKMEIIERISAKLKEKYKNEDDEANRRLSRVQVHTFHSFSFKMIRDFHAMVGFPRTPKPCTREGFGILKEVMRAHQPIVEAMGMNQNNKPFSARDVMKVFDIIKLNIVKGNKKSDFGVFDDMFELYTQTLRAQDRIEFHDMPLLCNQLFKKQPAVLRDVSRCYPYILVDEVQDINWCQRDILTHFLSGSRRMTVVGDVDQLIYGFQGAHDKHLETVIRTFQTPTPTPPAAESAGGPNAHPVPRQHHQQHHYQQHKMESIETKYTGDSSSFTTATHSGNNVQNYTFVALRVNYRSVMPIIRCCNVMINDGCRAAAATAAMSSGQQVQVQVPTSPVATTSGAGSWVAGGGLSGKHFKDMVSSPHHPYVLQHGAEAADSTSRVRLVECIGSKQAEIDFIIVEILEILEPYFVHKQQQQQWHGDGEYGPWQSGQGNGHSSASASASVSVAPPTMIRPQDIAILCRTNDCIGTIRTAVRKFTAEAEAAGGPPMFGVKTNKNRDDDDIRGGGSRGSLDATTARIVRQLNNKTEAQMMLACLKLYFHNNFSDYNSGGATGAGAGTRAGEAAVQAEADALCMLALPPVSEVDIGALGSDGTGNGTGSVYKPNAYGPVIVSLLRQWEGSSLSPFSLHNNQNNRRQPLYAFLVEQSLRYSKCTVLVGWCKAMAGLFQRIHDDGVLLSSIVDVASKSQCLGKYFDGLPQNRRRKSATLSQRWRGAGTAAPAAEDEVDEDSENDFNSDYEVEEEEDGGRRGGVSVAAEAAAVSLTSGSILATQWNKHGRFKTSQHLKDECVGFQKNSQFRMGVSLETQLRLFIGSIEGVMCAVAPGEEGHGNVVMTTAESGVHARKRGRDGFGPDRVWLGTVHRSKGLQWKVVFVYNTLEERYFPPTCAEDDNCHKNLLYVAMSRAEVTLYMSHMGKYNQATQDCVLTPYLKPLTRPRPPPHDDDHSSDQNTTDNTHSGSNSGSGSGSGSGGADSIADGDLLERWEWDGRSVRIRATTAKALLPPPDPSRRSAVPLTLPIPASVASASVVPSPSITVKTEIKAELVTASTRAMSVLPSTSTGALTATDHQILERKRQMAREQQAAWRARFYGGENATDLPTVSQAESKGIKTTTAAVVCGGTDTTLSRVGTAAATVGCTGTGTSTSRGHNDVVAYGYGSLVGAKRKFSMPTPAAAPGAPGAPGASVLQVPPATPFSISRPTVAVGSTPTKPAVVIDLVSPEDTVAAAVGGVAVGLSCRHNSGDSSQHIADREFYWGSSSSSMPAAGRYIVGADPPAVSAIATADTEALRAVVGAGIAGPMTNYDPCTQPQHHKHQHQQQQQQQHQCQQHAATVNHYQHHTHSFSSWPSYSSSSNQGIGCTITSTSTSTSTSTNGSNSNRYLDALVGTTYGTLGNGSSESSSSESSSSNSNSNSNSSSSGGGGAMALASRFSKASELRRR